MWPSLFLVWGLFVCITQTPQKHNCGLVNSMRRKLRFSCMQTFRGDVNGSRLGGTLRKKKRGGKEFSGECRRLPGDAIAGFQRLWISWRLESTLVFFNSNSRAG